MIRPKDPSDGSIETVSADYPMNKSFSGTLDPQGSPDRAGLSLVPKEG